MYTLAKVELKAWAVLLVHMTLGTLQTHRCVHAGSFVKVEVRSEAFWCRVQRVEADGLLHATVDNNLLRSDLRRGHAVVIRPEDVLEVVDVADQLSFTNLACALGSENEAALAWRAGRIACGRHTPKPNTCLILPSGLVVQNQIK